MKVNLVGLGAGGHAKVLIEATRSSNIYEVAALLDRNLIGQVVLGVPVIGEDKDLPRLFQGGIKHFFVGIGSVGDMSSRRRVFDYGLSCKLEPATIVHRDTVISASAQLGAGTAVLAGAVLNADARVGANVIINTGAIVEHDCVIEDHVHIATGARLAGHVQVGMGSHIGIGATVRQGIAIGANTIVGAGAVVVNDIPAGWVVVGVLARPIRRNDSE